MSAERRVLRADDELRGNPSVFEQARGCRGPLQTKHLFPIPDACRIDRPADTADRVAFALAQPARPAANRIINGGEIPATKQEVKMEKRRVGAHGRKEHVM